MDEKRMQQENMELKRKVAEANMDFKYSEKKSRPSTLNSSFDTPQHRTLLTQPIASRCKSKS